MADLEGTQNQSRTQRENAPKAKKNWKSRVGAKSKAQKSEKTSKCQVFSSTVPAWGNFFKKTSRNFLSKWFWSPVSHIVPKNVKRSFWTSILLQNRKKLKEGPFGVIEKICEKSLAKPKQTCTKKFWSRAGLEPTSFCLADLKKSSKKSEAEEATLVWQLVEASLWSF